MIKIFGIILIFISAALTGLFMNRLLKERTEILKDIKSGAIHIKNEIEYRKAPLDECFRGRGRLFSNAYKLIIKKSLTPKEAVKEASKALSSINFSDRELISNFADNLSCEDFKGQIGNFELFIASLSENIQASIEECVNKGKLYCYGGVLTGLGLAIILL